MARNADRFRDGLLDYLNECVNNVYDKQLKRVNSHHDEPEIRNIIQSFATKNMDPILDQMRRAIRERQDPEPIARNSAIAAFALCGAVDSYSDNETTQYINRIRNG